VFEDVDDLHKRIDDPKLDVDESCILVLKNCGPKGYPGIPEVGNFALPAKMLKKGVTDMVRISDARMSGTAYGTVVLHTAPEAAAGGPLALVRNGDIIEIDVLRKNNHIHVDYFYRLMPGWMGRALSTGVDVLRCAFLGYSAWLTWLLIQRIGAQRMAIVDLPMGWVFGAMLFGFTLMFLRSLQVAWTNWRRGWSVLERPEGAT
jgi:hypothetical protein